MAVTATRPLAGDKYQLSGYRTAACTGALFSFNNENMTSATEEKVQDKMKLYTKEIGPIYTENLLIFEREAIYGL